MNSAIPSGWYPDPSGLDFDRFWDGTNWTNQTRPKDIFGQNVFGAVEKEFPILDGDHRRKTDPAAKGLLLKIGAGVVALLLILGIGFFVTANRSDSRLNDAVAACGVADASGIVFAEDGQSLVFDGKGEEDYTGGDFNDVKCLLEALEAPSTVWAQMTNTTASMGQQQQDFDGINTSWNYHPDKGLNTTFKILE